MKKKGFTLIELLAVIVILAVIALISVPIILNVVEKARKGAFEDSAYGIIDAAKLYYTETSLDSSNINEIFTFPNDTKLKISGTKPLGGNVILDEKGKIELAIHNGKWCALKGKEEEKVTIIDYIEGKCGIEDDSPENVPESCFMVGVDTSHTSNKKTKIIEYTCTNQNIVIPNSIDGTEITEIGSNAFAGKGLKQVTIPNTITIIGDNAFEENQLTSIKIPKSVTSLGSSAFIGNQLQSVEIQASIRNIGESAFAVNQLKTITIPFSVTHIGEFAFAENQLTNVIIPDGVEYISNYAFSENQLQNIEIPKSVTYIAENAFEWNQDGMKVIVNKKEGSISGSPWGATSVEWNG